MWRSTYIIQHFALSLFLPWFASSLDTSLIIRQQRKTFDMLSCKHPPWDGDLTSSSHANLKPFVEKELFFFHHWRSRSSLLNDTSCETISTGWPRSANIERILRKQISCSDTMMTREWITKECEATKTFVCKETQHHHHDDRLLGKQLANLWLLLHAFWLKLSEWTLTNQDEPETTHPLQFCRRVTVCVVHVHCNEARLVYMLHPLSLKETFSF